MKLPNNIALFIIYDTWLSEKQKDRIKDMIAANEDGIIILDGNPILHYVDRETLKKVEIGNIPDYGDKMPT